MQDALKLQSTFRQMMLKRDIACHASKSSPPPNPLDRVLQKAAGKLRLAHPAAPSPSQQEQSNKNSSSSKSQSKRSKNPPSSATPTIRAPKQQHSQPKQAQDVDDDVLFGDITESDRDSVWEAIKLEVEGSGSNSSGWLDDDENPLSRGPNANLPGKRRTAPASAREDGSSSSLAAASQPVASTSGFKGFGAPPRRPEPSTSQPAAGRAANAGPRSEPPVGLSTSHVQPKQPAEKQSQRARSGRSGALRVFLFNAEEARTQSLLQELGMAGRAQVVSELRGADLILAAKLTKSGKHVNLTQGERTAANMGIPFVVVGRNLSADNLRAALEPLLDLSPEEAAALVAQRAAERARPSAAELQEHRFRVAKDIGELVRKGTLLGAADTQ